MKKKIYIYLIIIWTITLGVIIFSSVRTVKNYGPDIKDFVKTNIFDDDDFDFDEDYDDDNDWSDTNSSSKKMIKEELDSFTKLDLDANIMRVTIRQGDSYKLECSYNKEKLRPDFKVLDGELRIIQHIKKSNSGNNKCNLILTLPRDANLSEADINVNVGEIIIENMEIDDLDAKTDVGNLSIVDTAFKELDAETNVGELKIKTLNSLEEYDMDLKTDIGELSVGDKELRHSYRQKGSENLKISARTNVGSLKIR